MFKILEPENEDMKPLIRVSQIPQPSGRQQSSNWFSKDKPETSKYFLEC